MMPHEAAAIAYIVGGSSSGASAVAKSAAADVNAVLFPNAMPSAGAAMVSAATATGASTTTVCNAVLKLIEETLQYLTKVINYAPEESLACLRQLLKYLFARNYDNRQQQQQQHNQQKGKQGHYPTTKTFIKTFFKAKCKELHCLSKDDGCRITTIPNKQHTNQPPPSSSPLLSSAAAAAAQDSTTTPLSMFAHFPQHPLSIATKTASTTMPPPTPPLQPVQLSTKETSVLHDYDSSSLNSVAGLGDFAANACYGSSDSVVGPQDDYLLLAELFASSLEFHTWKSEHEPELSKHIKLFEPLVIHCLTVSKHCINLVLVIF